MTFPSGLDITRGLASGCKSVRRFGRNSNIGSTFVPVARGGVFRTPQVGSEVPLRIRAGGSTDDTANGIGGRSVTFIGLDIAGNVVSETVQTAGALASAATQQKFLRLTDAFVASSGTYATQTARSHIASIVVEDVNGVEWATIQDTDVPRATTEIAVYSIPKNRSAVLTGIRVYSDVSNKVNIIMFQRQQILQTAPPYAPMAIIGEFPSIVGAASFEFSPPAGPFPELTDIGFMAKAASTAADIAISFSLVEFVPR